MQDNWQIVPRLTLDLGLRLDHDSLSSEAVERRSAHRVRIRTHARRPHCHPRRRRTLLRQDSVQRRRLHQVSGADHYQLCQRTATRSSPVRRHTRTCSPLPGLRVPYSLGWTLQLDRELAPRTAGSYRLRRPQGVSRLLRESGSVADERRAVPAAQQWRARVIASFWPCCAGRQTSASSIYASYVHSRAHGDLNDYNQFFGNFPYPLIRPNQYGPLSSDAPNRGLFWAVIGLPYKFDFVPILDVHTGFPFSRLDQNWNYLGQGKPGRTLPCLSSAWTPSSNIRWTSRSTAITFSSAPA